MIHRYISKKIKKRSNNLCILKHLSKYFLKNTNPVIFFQSSNFKPSKFLLLE